ncbi:TPA: helix-turn-helix domain-containing protein [Acinetobacter baumannii]|nr:helix-turn-helix domain-containing protein [Acinetobacter baumannii]
MITCKLSSLMGDRKILKLSEVVHATGINRNTLTSMYYDRAVRIEWLCCTKIKKS